MANEHSIRVSARGEFGQLAQGLKNLQKDLNGVLGEIDKGARRGGVFDETQLRALDLYRSRFKTTMNDVNREFARQNDAVDALHAKKAKASSQEQKDIDKEIQKREKQLDVLRRQAYAVENLSRKREQEARAFKTMGSSSTASEGSTGTGSTGGYAGIKRDNLASRLGGGVLGAGKFALGLAGVTGIASMAMEAYQKAYSSQVSPLNLSQRLRGNGYSGSAKDMWDVVGGVGRSASMGYTSEESWQFQDMYSRQAGAMDPRGLSRSLMFGRAYGLEVGETADALGSMRQLGGVQSASQFADLIAGSVAKSGMTPRILEVMQTSVGLLSQMNTTLRDTGAKQILAYQTTLDTIGNQKGMMGITGQQGANVIAGLGGIYSPTQDNKWKYLGMQALQRYNPKKYGSMDLYGLETSFEDGLLNPDNLPAMSKYLKEKSGGNTNLEKRMLQRWLQDGGYNATKTQVNDLYSATNGLTAFDKDKMSKVTADLEQGDGTSKYQERMGQLGQEILDVNARFEKQLENLGQPLIEVITDLKGGVTDILEKLNETTTQEKIQQIYDFIKDNWAVLATGAGIAGLAKILSDRLPKGGGGGGKNNGSGSKNVIVPAGTKNVLKKGLKIGGPLAIGKQLFDTLSEGNEKKHQQWAEKAGLDPKDVKWTDRFMGEMFDMFGGGQTFYNMLGSGGSVTKGIDGFMGSLFPSWNVPESKDHAKQREKLMKSDEPYKVNPMNPVTWFGDPGKGGAMDIKIPESWGENFKEMKTGFFRDFIEPMNKTFGWDLGGLKREQAVNSLVDLGNNGKVNIAGLTEHGKAKIQELADNGLIKLEEGKQSTITTLSGFTDSGKQQLTKLADDGLISIGGFTEDGTAKITVLSSEGREKLEKLKKNGSIDIGEFKKDGTKQIVSLSKKGSEELINLQKNGSLHLDSMDKKTHKELDKVREKTKTSLDDIKGEHKDWKDKLIGPDGIFPRWAEGITKLWKKFIDKINPLNWFGSGDSSIGSFGISGGGKALSSATLSYKGALEQAGKNYGIEDTDLLLAIMNQESHGQGNNPMQVNGVTDAKTSVDSGVKYFAKVLKKAGGDVELALQAYNMGEGYINFVKKNGGKTTPALAKKFSEQQKAKYGYNIYGDPDYVSHVLQYYPKTSVSNLNSGNSFFNGWQKRVTAEFGAKDSVHTTPHGGLDIDGVQGQTLQALAGGKVKFIHYDDGSSKDKDGKANTRSGGTEIGIQMPNGETYFYSHLSKVAPGLKVGSTIKAGQYVGNVGGDRGKPGSGYSTTGSHLHLGYMSSNGTLKNARQLLASLGIGSGMGDSSIGVMPTDTAQTLNINVNLTGEVQKLNGATEAKIKKIAKQAIKEYRQQQLLMNPTVR